MNRYNLTRQGVQYFINKNLDAINADGIEHARQTTEGWQFDAEAVRIIDELRGYSRIAVIEELESERIKELQQENKNLQQLLLIAQSKLIKTQEELNENQKKLLSAEQKSLNAESQAKDSQSEFKLEKTLHNATKQQLEETKNRLEKAESQLEKIKNRGLIDRILNKS